VNDTGAGVPVQCATTGWWSEEVESQGKSDGCTGNFDGSGILNATVGEIILKSHSLIPEGGLVKNIKGIKEPHHEGMQEISKGRRKVVRTPCLGFQGKDGRPVFL